MSIFSPLYAYINSSINEMTKLFELIGHEDLLQFGEKNCLCAIQLTAQIIEYLDSP